MDARRKEARRIQGEIGKILLHDWDPIGVKDVPEAADEYDGYVGGIYRLLASGATADEVAKHLWDIEIGIMGLTRVPGSLESLRPTVEKLLAIDVHLHEVADFAGMTVNERLFAAGLLEKFDTAAKNRDRATMVSLLVKTALPRISAEESVDTLLSNPTKYGYPDQP